MYRFERCPVTFAGVRNPPSIVQLYVNGNKAGELIDLYNNGVVPSGPIAIGTHTLKKGENILTIEIKGANDKAVKSYMFGLDEIIVEK